ncbi:MAG: type III secretion system export apparatus subunit SctS [Janthinobacterium lividum]
MKDDIAYFAARALFLAFRVSMPVVLTSAAVGVLTSLLQAVTHVQDQTLPFALKLTTAIVVLALSGFWMSQEISSFTNLAFALIVQVSAGAGARE